jgi:hypothetical protein
MESALGTHAALTRCLLKIEPALNTRCGPGSMPDRFNHAIKFFDEKPDRRIRDGKLIGDSLVETAVSMLPATDADRPWQEELHYLPPTMAALLRALEMDGFTVAGGSLRRTLPVDLELPEAEDEITRLLKKHDLTTPKGHLDQALDAHGRGDWAAANGQIRTFLGTPSSTRLLRSSIPRRETSLAASPGEQKSRLSAFSAEI